MPTPVLMDGMDGARIVYSPLPVGYAAEQLARTDVEDLTTRLASWYPDIVVGAESPHLRGSFY